MSSDGETDAERVSRLDSQLDAIRDLLPLLVLAKGEKPQRATATVPTGEPSLVANALAALYQWLDTQSLHPQVALGADTDSTHHVAVRRTDGSTFQLPLLGAPHVDRMGDLVLNCSAAEVSLLGGGHIYATIRLPAGEALHGIVLRPDSATGDAIVFRGCVDPNYDRAATRIPLECLDLFL